MNLIFLSFLEPYTDKHTKKENPVALFSVKVDYLGIFLGGCFGAE